MINIRNVDPELWKLVKVEAVRHNVNVGAMLNLVISDWQYDHHCEFVQEPAAVRPTA